jgi:hypothetical protein
MLIFDPYAYELKRSARLLAQPNTPLAADALLAVPPEARDTLWHGLRAAIEDALDLYERTPPGVKRPLPAFPLQHTGQPRFGPAALRGLTLEGWHHLTGIELRIAAHALETLIYDDTPKHRETLGEQCARIGQLYSELKHRAGQDIALTVLRGDLRLLRHRNSPIVGPLIYD